MKLSIKHPKSILWKTNYDAESLEEALKTNSITDDWLVCPLGESEKTITVKEYITDPTQFPRVQSVANSISSETSNPLSILQLGLITILSAGVFRITLQSLFSVQLNAYSHLEIPHFRIALWNLLNDLATIGLWAGTALIVIHIVRSKNCLA